MMKHRQIKPASVRTIRSALAVCLVSMVSLAHAGSTAEAKDKPAEQNIKVTMTDIKYSVTTVKVKKGVPVTFTFVNKGKVVHEAVVGTHADQIAHDKEMAAMGGMVMADEPTAIALKPGVTKKLRYTFAKSGVFEVGCHTPGHYSAGMKIDVVVS
jgi:uncharacterized cupredoxin-like copper-binding protein